MAVGGKVVRMSVKQLNTLLARVLDDMGRGGLTVITKDDTLFKPWLPESYWSEQRAAELISNATIVTNRKAVRQAEDDYLAAQASVEDLLEEGIAPMWQPEHDTGWGTTPMHRSGGRISALSEDDPQPSYNYECYQCGRPITEDGKDHAGRTRCDQALLPQEAIDTDDYWWDHQAKPWHGEEEDDE